MILLYHKITQDELDQILDDHKLWLKTMGQCGKCAVLSNYDLRGMDLSYRDLDSIDFSGSCLRQTDFRGSCLVFCTFDYADMTDMIIEDCILGGNSRRFAVGKPKRKSTEIERFED